MSNSTNGKSNTKAQRDDKPIVDPTGRLPPHSADAELNINATLLVYPDRWFDMGGWLPIEAFFNERDGLVYEAIGKLVVNDKEVDPFTVKTQLESLGTWPRVGEDHLAHIMQNGAVLAPLIERMAQKIYAKWIVRKTIALAQQVASEGYGPIEDDDAWAEAVSGRFAAVANGTTQETGRTAKDIVKEIFTEWSAEGAPANVYLGTGNAELDRVFRKMRPSQLIVIGAHSGIGKSALAAGIGSHAALYETHADKSSGVYIQSLEMSAAEYMERMVFSYARVDNYKLDEEHRAKITEAEWARVTDAAKLLSIDHLYIDDRPDITPSGIRASVKRQALKMERAGTPLRLVIVDYAQIVNGDNENKRRSDNREQEVAQVGRTLKKLAKELKIPVILLAQLNEDSIKDGRKPRASDLRESRALKMDADKVVLIFNPSAAARAAAYRNGERMEALQREHVDLIVDKNRGARTGTVAATFYPSYTLFTKFDGDEADLAQLRAAGESVKTKRSGK